MGTPQGEAKNNGYKNLVRYANLKYCIIDQLRNPTPGFEEVIRRNFFIKKDMIMRDVDEWIELAKTEEALYCGQNNLDSTLGQKGVYLDYMETLRKELIVEFDKLDSPYLDNEHKPPSNITQEVEEKKIPVTKKVKTSTIEDD